MTTRLRVGLAIPHRLGGELLPARKVTAYLALYLSPPLYLRVMGQVLGLSSVFHGKEAAIQVVVMGQTCSAHGPRFAIIVAIRFTAIIRVFKWTPLLVQILKCTLMRVAVVAGK